MLRRMGRAVLTILITTLLGGLIGGALIRLAPGFDTDARELDSRLSEESLRHIRESRSSTGYLRRMLSGDLGVSQTLGRPVTELLAERLPTTLRWAGTGLALAWTAGLLLAWMAAIRVPGAGVISGTLSALLICLPSSGVALLLVLANQPGALAIALVLFPVVFRYSRGLLGAACVAPHVLMARAKGLRPWRSVIWHVLPPVLPGLLSLAGVSLGLALGASVPVEVICDSPGIGQLAWKAALERDLPVLVSLTLVVTLFTVSANCLSDLLIAIVPKPCAASR